ncbi:chemotaxis protein MotB [Rhodovarius crocodyli]|uniref:Chemotaxis protein MotB n=1 Tax=Rhodovarius crocodyli TaxID=1979269 RepID=A0A437MH48_9PROT|nr:flagellar motor protein MotB [Rhodovarius crocodyli]RVT96984.1 chemotaxis protein MotB [Rhodovarius crocodyli]
MARNKGDGVTIVIKKIEEGGGGHHGGAWKVAYADFVTAMMAFFLLMWLLNATTEEQRRGLADYFSPSNALSSGSSGMGQPFGGTTINSVGTMARDAGAIRVERGHNPTRLDIEDESDELEQPPTARREGPPGEEEQAQRNVAADQPGRPGGARQTPARTQGAERDTDAGRMTDMALRAELARREQAAMEQAADQLREEIRQNPATAELAQQVSVEITPEGLRIQLIDADGQPMFASGNAQPTERTRALIRAVALAAARLPNPIQITGHTDSVPFRGDGRTNWELSAERANAARRLLAEAGVADQRFRAVTGAADRELHLPDQPQAAGNRRVAITMLRISDQPRGAGAAR